MEAELRFQELRHRMVEEQLVGRSIRDQRLLEVMHKIPRHQFIPSAYRHLAYEDGPLPIGEGQTISQPYMVALMTQLLQLQGDEKVLEIGTGSGYQAAILACLAKQVFTIERHAALAEQASRNLSRLGITNVSVITGDGSLGLPEEAPFDGIMLTAAAPRVPKPLFKQLAEGGRLVAPIGGVKGQYLNLWIRKGEKLEMDEVAPVAFVPLRGAFGWSVKDWEDI
jgi:protein-L-isoaspartate(D-aspartate) O-methyltransferase